jgi:hypothetical protein
MVPIGVMKMNITIHHRILGCSDKMGIYKHDKTVRMCLDGY